MHTSAHRRAWKLERDRGGSIQALKSMHWAERRDGRPGRQASGEGGVGRNPHQPPSSPSLQPPGPWCFFQDPSLCCLLAFIPPLISTCHALPSSLSFCKIPAHLSRLRGTVDSSAKTPPTSPNLALTPAPT